MPSFLSPLRVTSPRTYLLRNRSNGAVLAESIEVAFDSRSRKQGLLQRDSLPAGSALIIAPTSAIHTFFMKFTIDVVFITRDGRVRKAVRELRPWRIAGSLGSHSVVEMPAGALANAPTEAGDQLELILKPPI